MADKSINELVAASAISASDLFVLEQNATAKKLTGQVLINFLTAAADGHGGISVIAKTGTAGLVDTYTITYADTSISTFTITNGAKGDTGQAYYVWIRYSAVQPTQDNEVSTTPDDWMGIYTGTSATAPTAYAAYTWYEIKGAKGDTGAAAAISSQAVTYQASISGTDVPGGTWQSEIPTVTQGNYLWTRTVLTFNDGTSITSYSVGRMGVDGQGSPSSTTPNAAGTATVGVETAYARGDHIHPKELTDAAVKTAMIEANAVTPEKTSGVMRNANLLDNWDFRNPVNQRGQTSYAGAVHTIDRFKSSGGTVTVNDNSITYANSTGQGDGYLLQYLENSENYKGFTLTVSVNFLSGSSTKYAALVCYRPTSPGYVIYFGNVVTNGGVSTVTGVVPADTTLIEVRAEIGDGGAIGVMTIETMKLELGTVSTLANDPPADYGAELAKCQRYYLRNVGGWQSGLFSGSNFYMNIPTPVTMRATPVAVLNGSSVQQYDGSTFSAQSVGVEGLVGNGVKVWLSVSGTPTSGTMGFLRDTSIDFSAEL